MIEFSHKSVMLKECVDALKVKDGGVYFDGTLGGGGHSAAILSAASNVRLIATDLDDDALSAASDRLKSFEFFKGVKANYKDFASVLDQNGIDLLDGAILDFGVSSYQLDNEQRGFSYMKENSPLDMRMNKDAALSAADVVNGYSYEKLREIIKKYGEEDFASNIAKNIVARREQRAYKTCGELVKTIEDSIPRKFRQNGPCARKTFQAIRIEVNDELNGLYDCVVNLALRLKRGGRLAILTFHSLEDRIVKNAFNYLEADCICDKRLPVCVCGKRKEVTVINKKPITAGDDELAVNSRSKSAKLRIAERV